MNNQKLNRTRAALRKAEAMVKDLAAMEAKCLMEGVLKKDSNYIRAEQEGVKLRRRLHVIRLNITRKKYSVRSHQAHISKTETLIAEFQIEEQNKAMLLQAAEAQKEQIRKAFEARILADIAGKTQSTLKPAPESPSQAAA